MSLLLDHLVVAAATLEQGVAWCEAVLGVTPAPGGAHALFGTHNRLLKLSGAPDAYLEIIAIDPTATPLRPPPLRRWFDLDDTALQASLRHAGPQLVHWVARVQDIDVARDALGRAGWERGPVLEASRPTPDGLLRWKITVRDDGRRLGEGALPTLIQWGERHPAQGLPQAGVSIRALRGGGAQGGAVTEALRSLDATPLWHHDPDVRSAALCATLDTPRGPVTLHHPAGVR